RYGAEAYRRIARNRIKLFLTSLPSDEIQLSHRDFWHLHVRVNTPRWPAALAEDAISSHFFADAPVSN
ncbi:MAG: hypothetical protein WBV78_10140, partial [Roseobacter sp.]